MKILRQLAQGMGQKRWWGSRPSTRTEEKDEDIEKIWGWVCKIWGE